MSAGRRLAGPGVGLGGTFLGVLVGSPTVSVGPWVVVAMMAHWRRGRIADKERQRLLADLPAFVDAVIQRLKAGGSLTQAVQATMGSSVVEAHLVPMRRAMQAGAGLGHALRRQQLALRSSEDHPPALDLVVNVLVVLVERGGQALPSLERLNDTLRSAQWVESEVRTQSGQAVASAVMLAALPGLFVVGLTMLDDRLARFYLFTVTGTVCLLVAAALAYTGLWWMSHIIGSIR